MARVTNEEILEKLNRIEYQARSDKFLFFGFFIFTLGITVIINGFAFSNNWLILVGVLLSFTGVQSWHAYSRYMIDKEKRKK